MTWSNLLLDGYVGYAWRGASGQGVGDWLVENVTAINRARTPGQNSRLIVKHLRWMTHPVPPGRLDSHGEHGGDRALHAQVAQEPAQSGGLLGNRRAAEMRVAIEVVSYEAGRNGLDVVDTMGVEPPETAPSWNRAAASEMRGRDVETILPT